MSLNEFRGIVLEMVKLYPLLYADDIILFSDSETGLQNGRDTLKTYCDKWKLSVNVTKTEVMFFFFFLLFFFFFFFLLFFFFFFFENPEKYLILYHLLTAKKTFEIVNHFSYLGVTFASGDPLTVLLK